MLNYKNPRDPENIQLTRLMKNWLRVHFNLDEEVGIWISEINCADENCPVKETAIVLFLPDGEKKFSIHKPLTFIRERDIVDLKR